MGFLSFLFGVKKREVERFLKNGALILDVRTLREYNKGAIENSMHIPLNNLRNHIDALKQLNKPLIVCCKSGVRSAKAAKFLNLNNINATNGGGWINLNKML